MQGRRSISTVAVNDCDLVETAVVSVSLHYYYLCSIGTWVLPQYYYLCSIGTAAVSAALASSAGGSDCHGDGISGR